MAMLRGVIDPELGSDIVDLGMAKGATVDGDGNVVITIALTTSGCPLRAQIQKDVRSRISSTISFTTRSRSATARFIPFEFMESAGAGIELLAISSWHTQCPYHNVLWLFQAVFCKPHRSSPT